MIAPGTVVTVTLGSVESPTKVIGYLVEQRGDVVKIRTRDGPMTFSGVPVEPYGVTPPR